MGRLSREVADVCSMGGTCPPLQLIFQRRAVLVFLVKDTHKADIKTQKYSEHRIKQSMQYFRISADLAQDTSCHHNNMHSAKARNHMSNMSTAIIRSSYICVFSASSLVEDSYACSFSSSSFLPEKKVAAHIFFLKSCSNVKHFWQQSKKPLRNPGGTDNNE